jgi:hypothetical protein
MYALMCQLVEDRQRALLEEAAKVRLVRAAAGDGGRARRGALRRVTGRRLIALGSRLAGVAVPAGYRQPAAGEGAR